MANNGTENKTKVDINNLTEEQKNETTEAPPISEEGTEDVGETEKTYTEEETASAYEIVKADKKAKRKKIRNKILKILGIAGGIAAVGAAGYAMGHNSETVPYEEDDDEECDGSDAEFYDNESEEE